MHFVVFSFEILHSVLNSAVEVVKSVESLIWMSASEVGDEGPFKVCLEQLGQQDNLARSVCLMFAAFHGALELLQQ